mgnify:CR=1 FL=1
MDDIGACLYFKSFSIIQKLDVGAWRMHTHMLGTRIFTRTLTSLLPALYPHPRFPATRTFTRTLASPLS